MGSGGSKAHEAFAVTPADTVATTLVEVDAGELPDHVSGQLEQLQAVAGMAGPNDGDTYGGAYQQLSGLTAQLLHEADDLPAPAAEELTSQVKAATSQFLTSLDDNQLQQLAGLHGFDHPTLVGLSNSGTHPLMHWLDPAYPAGLASKAQIQAKATERWQQLAAGHTINGLTWEEVAGHEHALGLTAATAGTWSATPVEVTGLMAQLADQTNQLPSPYGLDYPDAVAALIDTEGQLQTAQCPELGDSLAQLQAAASGMVGANVNATRQVAIHMVDQQLVPDAARWLTPSEVVAVARTATSDSEKDALTQLAADRAAAVKQLAAYHAEGTGTATGPMPADGAELADWVKATAKAATLRQEMAGWAAKAADPAANSLAGPGGSSYQQKKQKALSTAFRAWAKGQKLADLRATAADLGLAHDGKASRAQVQNYLASHWDTSLDATSLQADVTAKATTSKAPLKAVPAATPTPAASTATAPKTAKPPTSVAARAEAYLGTLGTLKAKLRAHQTLANDLPPAVPSTTVRTHDWGSGTTFSKGSHTSTVHDGPDGHTWMFKPDTSAKGARAHAESAASAVYQRVGIPGVRVHVATIGNNPGSVQPLVPGASPLSDSPTSWSQADVDAVVQLHVAAWAVGDHDAHSSNVMRSPGGALFAVDQGQAFKFYGRDKLTDSWRPATNHGTPVYQQAYHASGTGTLAAGVNVRAKAALPVLNAFEAIPDSQYRDMLRPTAVEGVKHGVAWVDRMRAAAKERHGTTTATDAQIVDEFLAHAVERKQRLRDDFTALFNSLGVDDADHLTWVS